MNKAQFIDMLTAQFDSRAEAAHAVDAVVDTVIRAVVAGEKVAITGLGVFAPAVRPARTGRNPQTGDPVAIPGRRVVRFRAGVGFNALMNGDRELPPVGRPASAKQSRRGDR